MILFILIVLQTHSVYSCDLREDAVISIKRLAKKHHRSCKVADQLIDSFDFLIHNSCPHLKKWNAEELLDVKKQNPLQALIEFRESLVQDVSFFRDNFSSWCRRSQEAFLGLQRLLKQGDDVDKDDGEKEDVLKAPVQCKDVSDALQNLLQCINSHARLAENRQQYMAGKERNIFGAERSDVRDAWERYVFCIIENQGMMHRFRSNALMMVQQENDFSVECALMQYLLMQKKGEKEAPRVEKSQMPCIPQKRSAVGTIARGCAEGVMLAAAIGVSVGVLYYLSTLLEKEVVAPDDISSSLLGLQD